MYNQGFTWAKNFEGETARRAGLMGCLGGPSRVGAGRDVCRKLKHNLMSMFS